MPKALKIFIIIIAAIALLFSLDSLNKRIDEQEQYNWAMKRFAEICDYVKQNEEHFIKISEYEMSKLTDETPSFLLERYDEYQDSRSIVFADFFDARASFNSITGKNEVRYFARVNFYYSIDVIYSDDISLGITSGSKFHAVSDDILVGLFYTPTYD